MRRDMLETRSRDHDLLVDVVTTEGLTRRIEPGGPHGSVVAEQRRRNVVCGPLSNARTRQEFGERVEDQQRAV